MDNYANYDFVRLYAAVRRFVFDDSYADGLADFLRGYMATAEKSQARKLNLPETTLVGKLVDIGFEQHPLTDAQDEPE
jgi:hypothetical protein